MLTDGQVKRVWEKMIEAEVRSLYFGDLAARYTKQKQIITGVAFFLSSGAAATLASKTNYWFPLSMSALSALLTAYSIAVGLDRKVATMAKLHSLWSQLEAGYDRLWNHWYEEDAEKQFKELLKRGREASEMGTTEAPYDERLIDKWEDRVYARYGANATA